MKIENPGDVEVTLTVTMKASAWEALRDELPNKWPASELTYRISDLLAQTRKLLWANDIKRDDPCWCGSAKLYKHCCGELR